MKYFMALFIVNTNHNKKFNRVHIHKRKTTQNMNQVTYIKK